MICLVIHQAHEVVRLLDSVDGKHFDRVTGAAAVYRYVVECPPKSIVDLEGGPIAGRSWIETQFVDIQSQSQ